MILCDLNLVTPVDNYHVLHKYNKLRTIESVLIEKKVLSRAIVEQTFASSEQEDIPLISSLLNTKQISASGMQKLLFQVDIPPIR